MTEGEGMEGGGGGKERGRTMDDGSSRGVDGRVGGGRRLRLLLYITSYEATGDDEQ